MYRMVEIFFYKDWFKNCHCIYRICHEHEHYFIALIKSPFSWIVVYKPTRELSMIHELSPTSYFHPLMLCVAMVATNITI